MNRIKDVKMEFGSPWLKYFSIEHDNGTWHMVSRKEDPVCVTGKLEADAVSIAAFHKDTNCYVVTKEFRHPINDYEYGIPAGLVDEGETVRDAARRELKEETGLEVVDFLRVTPPLYSSAGMTDEAVATVFAICTGQPTSKYTEENEDIHTMLLSDVELNELMHTQGIKFGARGYLSLMTMIAWEIDFS